MEISVQSRASGGSFVTPKRRFFKKIRLNITISDNYKKFRVKDFKQPKTGNATQRPQFHIERAAAPMEISTPAPGKEPRRWQPNHGHQSRTHQTHSRPRRPLAGREQRRTSDRNAATTSQPDTNRHPATTHPRRPHHPAKPAAHIWQRAAAPMESGCKITYRQKKQSVRDLNE